MERAECSLNASGIYQIQSTINGKKYIGSASRFKDRKWNHFKRLKDGNHGSFLLQRHYDKYGIGDLVFKIIETVFRNPDESIFVFKARLLEREQYYIDTLCPEFNINKLAYSCLGTIRSEEFKQKHRGENNASKRLEVREKQSEAKRKYWSEVEHPFGKANPFYNKRHTKESKNKSSISHGKLTIYKNNKFALGNRFSHTPEEIEKMRNSWTPEMREQASIRATRLYKEGKGIAEFNNNKVKR